MNTLEAVQVKERPILFSGAMVRAILEGRKTQTRRVVLHKKATPPEWATWVNHLKQLNMLHQWVDSNLFQWSEEQTPGEKLKALRRWPSGPVNVRRNFKPDMDYAIPCPYGKPGDRLWVRETWAIEQGGAGTWLPDACAGKVHYAADGANPPLEPTEHGFRTGRWRPSIFLPRWASRISLEIVKVRVERVQDISRSDAKAEGFLPSPLNGLESFDGKLYGNAENAFRALWDSINAKRGFGWDANPWVWVVEFKRLSSPATGKPYELDEGSVARKELNITEGDQ